MLDFEGFRIDRLRVLLAARARQYIQHGCAGYFICGRHADQGTDHRFPRGWTIEMRPRVRPGLDSIEWIRSSKPQVGENSLHGKDHREGWSREMLNNLERHRQTKGLVSRSTHAEDSICVCRSMCGY